jgi:hypothetical protein
MDPSPGPSRPEPRPSRGPSSSRPGLPSGRSLFRGGLGRRRWRSGPGTDGAAPGRGPDRPRGAPRSLRLSSIRRRRSPSPGQRFWVRIREVWTQPALSMHASSASFAIRLRANEFPWEEALRPWAARKAAADFGNALCYPVLTSRTNRSQEAQKPLFRTTCQPRVVCKGPSLLHDLHSSQLTAHKIYL